MKLKNTAKRTLSFVLSASMLISMCVMTATAVKDNGKEADFSEGLFGVCGNFTQWGEQNDISMTDDDGDGIYTAELSLNEGDYEFKIRYDNSWDYYWGDYRDNTNMKLYVPGGQTKDITVFLNTNGEDYTEWESGFCDTDVYEIDRFNRFFADLYSVSFSLQNESTGWGEEDDIEMVEYCDGVFAVPLDYVAGADNHFMINLNGTDKYWESGVGEEPMIVNPDAYDGNKETFWAYIDTKSADIEPWEVDVDNWEIGSVFDIENLFGDESRVFRGRSGSCKWKVDGSHILSIFGAGFNGEGTMKDYSKDDPSPWSKYEVNFIVINDGVLNVGDYAFYRNTAMAVELPDSVKSIGDYAFYGCDDIERIELPENVKSIGVCALVGATGDYIYVPASVCEIGENAIGYFSTFDDNGDESLVCIDEMEIEGFEGTEIQEYAEDNGFTFIKSAPFSKTIRIHYQRFEDDLDAYKDWSVQVWFNGDGTRYNFDDFDENGAIVTISVDGINDKVKSMGFIIATNDWSEKDVGIDRFVQFDTNEYQDIDVFCTTEEGNFGLTVNGQESTTLVYKGYSREGKYDYFLYNNGSLFIEGERICNGDFSPTGDGDSLKIDGSYRIKNVCIGEEVTSIGNEAFKGCQDLETVMLSEGLVEIGEYAFADCRSLVSVMIPQSVEEIGDYAFGYRTEDGLEIDPGFNIIGFEDSAAQEYANENNLPFLRLYEDFDEPYIIGIDSQDEAAIIQYYGEDEEVVIPEEIGGYPVTNICFNAFIDNSQIKSVVFPKTMKYIRARSFENCNNLESVTFNGPVHIGMIAFRDCTSLKELYLPDGSTVLGGAFMNCRELESVRLPADIEELGPFAFQDCNKLEEIDIPDSLFIVGAGVFEGTKWFDDQPDGEVYAGKVLIGYKGKMPENYVMNIKGGTTAVSAGCIGNSELVGIVLPESLKFIAEFGFMDCRGIKSVTIPESVMEIGPRAIGYYFDEGMKPVEGFTIIGKEDSEAQRYAIENGFDFVSGDAVPLANESEISTEKTEPGKEVVITGKASGGKAPYTYTYRCRLSGEKTWTVIGKSNTTAETKKLSLDAEGTYEIAVLVKDADSKVVSKTFELIVKSIPPLENKSFISAEETTTEAGVKVSARASGGTEPYTYTYQYKLRDAAAYKTYGKSNTATKTCTMKLREPGEYDLRVLVKDSSGKVVSKKFTVNVIAVEVFENTSTISDTLTIPELAVTLYGSAVNGTEPYVYTYRYKLSTDTKWKTIGTAASSDTSKTLKLSSTGVYDIAIYAKDASGKNTVKNFTLTVADPADVLLNRSTIAADTIAAGEGVKVNARAAGGTEPYTYTYQYKRTEDKSYKTYGKTNTSTKSCTIKFKEAGTFDIRVLVKDSTGKVASKKFSLTVT